MKISLIKCHKLLLICDKQLNLKMILSMICTTVTMNKMKNCQETYPIFNLLATN